MVSPGTRVVKNREPLSIPIEYQFKKTDKLKMLEPLCNQTVDLETDTRTLFITVN